MKSLRWKLASILDKHPGLVVLSILISNAVFIFLELKYGASHKFLVSSFFFVISFCSLIAVRHTDLIFYRLFGFKVYFAENIQRKTGLKIKQVIKSKCEELGIEVVVHYDMGNDLIYTAFQSDEDFNLLLLTITPKIEPFTRSIFA